MNRLWKRTLVAALVVAVLCLPLMAGAEGNGPPVGTAISDPLGGGFGVLELEDRPVTLSWGKKLPDPLYIERSYNCSVKATSLAEADGGQDFTKALFVIVVMIGENSVGPEAVTVVAEDDQALGYDEDGFFYWGPRTGFPLPAGHEETTEFTVTPHTIGDFTFTIWCVDVSGA